MINDVKAVLVTCYRGAGPGTRSSVRLSLSLSREQDAQFFVFAKVKTVVTL